MTDSTASTAPTPWVAALLRGLPRASLWAIVASVVTIAFTFLLPSRYTATTSFVATASPLDAAPSGGLAALASRFGIGGASASESPEFYAALLGDRSLLDPLLDDTFPAQGGRRSRLLDLLHAGGDTPARQLELGAKKLGNLTSTFVDDQTNIVTLSVDLPDPLAAAAVANLLVARLDSFNQVTRQSEAHSRRRFLEARLAAARANLAAAEDSLRSFYVRNRRIQDSPTLVFEEARLKRGVDLQSTLFESLSQEYEQARIDEVRDTPVLTILQPALIPTKRSWPRRGVSGAFAFVTVGLLSLMWTTWLELQRRSPEAAATALALRELLQQFLNRGRPRRRSAE